MRNGKENRRKKDEKNRMNGMRNTERADLSKAPTILRYHIAYLHCWREMEPERERERKTEKIEHFNMQNR